MSSSGCLNSDFDQYGDVESFGKYPEWQKQLSKFGFVQDRLREWQPSVLDKIKRFSCMTIASLDIDGFRIDKALTITVDAQADWSDHMRDCARRFSKTNFFIPGEIVGHNALGALYYGRGMEPRMFADTVEEGFNATNETSPSTHIRTSHALDSACFHYSAYRALTRFLGIDGVYGANMDTRINWAEGWQDMLGTNDFINANTGKFDPRHMFGVSNQDVFRWPSIINGTHKYLVGAFITSLLLPGIPIVNWGEEQAFYVLENIAGNYLYGRQPMTSTVAWELHGCYKVGSEKYFNFPLDAALYGCDDPNVSLDHRDPSHPIRAIIKRFLGLRSTYPALNDGFDMFQLSNHTHWIVLPGSEGTGTEMGLWSSVRMSHKGLQDFSGVPHGTLESSSKAIDDGGAGLVYGCISGIQKFPPWGFKAFVLKESWVTPSPTITKFLPGHDYRLESSDEGPTSVEIAFQFSTEMDCDSVLNSIEITSNSVGKTTATLNRNSVRCRRLSPSKDNLQYVAQTPSTWEVAATINDIPDGVRRITVRNATDSSKTLVTGSVDHFLLRVGKPDNPVIFPRHANYTQGFAKERDGKVYVRHKAAGATQLRCSQTWGSSWTPWLNYTGEEFEMPPKNWTGTSLQQWAGEHVVCQYYSKLAGSSHHQQEGDVSNSTRRFPHLFVNGHFNAFGFDSGIPNQMAQISNNGNTTWWIEVMAEWPTAVQFNVWGLNPDGLPDQTSLFGDVNFDFVLDRLPPGSLRQNVVNVTKSPPAPFLGWRFEVDDATMKYNMLPAGSVSRQIAIFSLMWIVPLLAGWVVVLIFTGSFYKVKHISGVARTQGLSGKLRQVFEMKAKSRPHEPDSSSSGDETRPGTAATHINTNGGLLDMEIGAPRKKVLIATMEYDIEDWAIKINIGGLGVMAQLMGKALGHLDIIWVVPCVGGLQSQHPNGYPVDQPAEPMVITVIGSKYTVEVQYHKLRNITYVLVDAPIFRLQAPSGPYPDRMDNLDSAIYYSAWNQCIAETLKRFNPDIYHINDFHGALAPLYLLPQVIPCCLSLHNAEFQGMWSVGNKEEKDEVCKVFNLNHKVVERFVQFGEVFNLLHAGASYLREFQHGFGAVGVSKKYGKRSFARYPIFWGLSKIGSLPNPDPSDTADWSPELEAASNTGKIEIDAEFESSRAELRRQAQEWAGLEQNADAQLFVFVGRWSMQKGVDLIADVFPSTLEHNPTVQLIAIGPVIDLYGKLAAIKLHRLMEQYPGRVYSKPEFTQLPPYIFSGAEFALIPSRDEPFGLVAVEFGKKGALGVGARVGGLGNMPGWYYTVESTPAKHLISQFKDAIQGALASDNETRAKMRAVSAKLRFPVARWVEEIEDLHSTSIRNALQKVDPFFTDADGEYTEEFTKKLASLDPRNSETETCIGQFLARSEKKWFEDYKCQTWFGFLLSQCVQDVSRNGPSPSPAPPRTSRFLGIPTRPHSPYTPSVVSSLYSEDGEARREPTLAHPNVSTCEAPDSPVPSQVLTSPLQKFMLRKLFGWPVYTIILALGQILGASSYQISLLNDEQGQTASMLYTIASIYAASPVLWWVAFRRLPSVWVLSTPFAVYGVAFLFVGIAPFASSTFARGWLQKVASGVYAAASSSGSMYFALNFGDEGGAPIHTWIIRACAVQGIQQIYISGLCNGIPAARASDIVISSICFPAAAFLIGLEALVFFGLPEYYRQTPGSIPSFFKSIFRRRLIICFLVAVVVQNYWFSSVYGRSWRFLWTTSHAPTWQILLLVVFFFGIVWVALFSQLAHLSREHSWIFPVLAIGLGASRWAQTFWGISGVGTSLPWAIGGSPAGGALVSRALWLWLGVLDALQGTGVGMMLLQTTTRFHNNFALVAAQVLGSIATILGRATAPNAVGPGPVFPNLALSLEGLGNASFWVCLLMQIAICVAFVTFFRKEQLSKP
ncbi:hypothetical protein OQA88_8457 [Cercophora sp. LCS_1]